MERQIKFNSPYVTQVDSMGFKAIKNSWTVSKPTLNYKADLDHKRLDDDIQGLLRNDLPISGFYSFNFEVSGSLVMRDVIMSFRPIVPWASSNRIIKIDYDNSSFDNVFIQGDRAVSLTKAKESFAYVVDAEHSGVALDVAKRKIPLMMLTEFSFTMDFRTLMCMLKTFEDLDPLLLHTYGMYFLYAIKDHIIKPEDQKSGEALMAQLYTFFATHPAQSIYKKLAITDEFYNTPVRDGKSVSQILQTQVAYQVDDVANQSYHLYVNAASSLGAQVIRSHYSNIRNEFFNLIKKHGYLYFADKDSEFRSIYETYGNLNNQLQVVSRRTCFVAQFDFVDQFGWSSILDSTVKDMTVEKFEQTLPCKGCGTKCTVSEETAPRLLSKTLQHSNNGHAPDQNKPCPILIEDYTQTRERINHYKSDENSEVVKKWISLTNLRMWDNKNNIGRRVYNGELPFEEYTKQNLAKYATTERSLPEAFRQLPPEPHKKLGRNLPQGLTESGSLLETPTEGKHLLDILHDYLQ